MRLLSVKSNAITKIFLCSSVQRHGWQDKVHVITYITAAYFQLVAC